MAIHDFLNILSLHPILTLLVSPIAFLLLRSLYRVSPFHPLSHVPGSDLYSITSLVLAYHAYIGNECSSVHSLHQRLGPIVRTGPNSVDISDGDALGPIYVEKGGFRKPAFYGNFDIDGHKSIFSEVDPAKRAPRAKAVTGIFSTSSLRQSKSTIDGCVDDFVARLKKEAATEKPVNILNLTRSLASDTVTAYLFGQSYGGLEEDRLSAAGMVDSFVAVSRFWYLPGWLFQLVEKANTTIWPDKHADESLARVDVFVRKVVSRTVSTKAEGPTNYPARLLEAGFSESEARAQCKDLMFAGTDSTGMNLATICFMLVNDPKSYSKLREEVLNNPSAGDEDLQALPYLRGIVKEGLRLSMANPARLPRVVPPGGWSFKGIHFPPGTVVSCTSFELHLNNKVFENALDFRPERWLNPTEEMNRDSIPFGLGTRQCIARNLATLELYCAVYKLVQADILRNARRCQDKIEILEWFNSKVIGEKIELAWS